MHISQLLALKLQSKVKKWNNITWAMPLKPFVYSQK